MTETPDADTPQSLKQDVKRMMVENLMLQITADQVEDTQPLFGPGGLGFDSVDALQLVVALDRFYGLRIPDPAAAKEILQNVNTIVDALMKHRATTKVAVAQDQDQAQPQS